MSRALKTAKRHDSIDLHEHAIREKARALVQDLGPNKAAALLGVSRSALLSLAADAPVARGTFAIVREQLRVHEVEARAQ
jgi:hypothetical protein